MQKLLNLFEKIQIFKYGIAAILLAVPLYPKFPLFSVPGIQVAVRLEDFLILTLSLAWFVYFVAKRSSSFFQDKLNQAIIIFLVCGLLSVISAILLTHTVSPHLSLLHWVRRIEYILPLFIATLAIQKTRKISFFVHVLFISSFFTFLYGLGQETLGFPVISTQNEEYAKGLALRWLPGSRLYSTFAGHYDLAAFLVMVLPIAFAYLFTYKKLRTRFFVFFVLIVPTFWLFFEAESRVSLFSFLLAITVTLWIIKKRVFILPIIAGSLVWAVFFSGLGGRYSHAFDVYWQKLINRFKITEIVVRPVYGEEVLGEPAPVRTRDLESKPKQITIPIFEDRSTSIRLKVEWPRAIRSFFKNPLLGTGYSSITLATDNDYLRLLGEVGILGALAFFLILARLTKKIIKYLKQDTPLDFERAYVSGFFGGFLGFLTNAIFIDVFEASKAAIIFWTLVGLTIGIINKKETNG